MTEVEALVTAARQYCLTNHAYWVQQYTERRTGNDFPYTYTKSDYDLFPRYNAIDAIRQGVELFVGRTEGTIDEVKKLLVEVAVANQTPFTKGENNTIEAKAIDDERRKFIGYVMNLSNEDLLVVEPLPFRRRLSEQDRQSIRGRLAKDWSFEGDYWVPLKTIDRPSVFLASESLTEEDRVALKEFVVGLANGRLFELTEAQIDYEVDPSEFDDEVYETVVCD